MMIPAMIATVVIMSSAAEGTARMSRGCRARTAVSKRPAGMRRRGRRTAVAEGATRMNGRRRSATKRSRGMIAPAEWSRGVIAPTKRP